MKKLKVILIGAGSRGTKYVDVMKEMPEKYEVVAVAEPIMSRRDVIKNMHNIDESMCFADYKELLSLPKMADLAIVATMDKMHFEPAMMAIEKKYDVLIEKPISPTPAECKKIEEYSKEMNVKVVVCHVLRYTPFFNHIKDAIDAGKIGKIMSINHEECVGNVHQSHSFVRGNWGNEERNSPMLLQKSCHDIDILQWLIGKKCKKVQSFGALSYFKKENAPENSPEYCIEGCPIGEICPYNAVKIYLEDKENTWTRSACAKEANPTDEQVEKAISTTQYGKCVYKCDNTVVDHQTVNMLFEDDVTATFTMSAFNRGGRFIHIMGTEGEIHAELVDDAPIKIYSFITKETEYIPIKARDGILGGHAGGDGGIISTLYEYLTGTYTGNTISEIGISCDNHITVFAAEKSRKTNLVVDIDEFKETLI